MGTYAGSQECQHLIHQFIIRKVSSDHHGAQNIRLEFLSRSPGRRNGSLLLTDNFITQPTKETRFIVDNAVQTPWKSTGKPLWQEEIHRQEGHLLPGWLQDRQKAVGHFVLGVMQRAKVAAHCGRSDDIQRQSAGPDAHFNLPFSGVVERGAPHFRLEFVQEQSGLLPHEPVQRADILDVERRGQRATLLAMGLSLRQNQPEPDNPGQEVPRTPWLLEVIGARAHHIQESLVTGDEQVRTVENIAEVDEAFIGDGPDPFERSSTTRVVEGDLKLREAVLSWRLCQLIAQNPAMRRDFHADGRVLCRRGNTFTVGKCRKGLTKKG